MHQKLIKKKSEPKTEKSIAERVKLKNEKIAEVKKEEKNIDYKLFKNYFTNYQSLSDMYKKLCDTGGKKKKNEDQVCLIKEVLNKMKKNYKCI